MATITFETLQTIISGIQTRLRKLEVRVGGSAIKTGVAADRPATPNVSGGTTVQYYAYDTKVLSIWNTNSSSWNTVSFT